MDFKVEEIQKQTQMKWIPLGDIADERVKQIFGRHKLNQRMVTDLATV